MSEQLAFVHFPHPGGEEGPNAEDGRLKRWDTDQHEHRRKFMRMSGAWRDDITGPTRKGEILFWGEWEAGSSVESVGDRVPGGPHWIHRPFYNGLEDAPRNGTRQNTDPFVFGDRFLYTYCRQPGNQKLRRLAPGSLILFGSTYRRQFVLDTCFVVGERVPHTPQNYRETAVPRVPSVFQETTLDPMYQQMGTSCSLYLGATPERPAANGTFSFVPCLPAGEGRTFARPAIKLKRPLIKLGRTQQAGTLPYDDPAKLRELWERVVAQVLGSCALGIRVAVPARTDQGEGMTHQSFVDFVEAVVLPARAANPTHRRLDGEHSGGNRSIFGEFRHRGKRWKVHSDTHYEPLLVAYDAAKAGADPFVEAPTPSGRSLDITDELRASLSERRHKYIYIYEMPG